MNDTQLTITGNLAEDPEFRFTPLGSAGGPVPDRLSPRFYDQLAGEWKDGETLFLTVNVWRQAAENVAESMTRGMRAIVTRRLAAALLREGRGKADRLRDRGRRGGRVPPDRHGEGHQAHPQQARGRNGSQGRGDAGPWASEASGGYSDEPPF